jgi:polyhydroxyalkanoate synthase
VDKYRTVDDYINGYLDDTVEFIRKRHGVEKIALFGICQGGTMSTTYSSLNPDKISHLTLTVSPIDFDAYKANHKPHEGLMFTMGADADVEKMVAVHGNVPAYGAERVVHDGFAFHPELWQVRRRDRHPG